MALLSHADGYRRARCIIRVLHEPPQAFEISLFQLQVLDDSIIGACVATGAFAPGQDIAFANFQAVQISDAGAPMRTIYGSSDQASTLDNDVVHTTNEIHVVTGGVGN